MRVVWLCEYPLDDIGIDAALYRSVKFTHPIPWIVELSKLIAVECADVDMHVVTQSRLIADDIVHKREGITFHILRDACAVPFTRRGWPPYFPLHLIIRYRPSRRRICMLLKTLKPDVVHVHGTEYCYGLAALDAGFPFVVSLQGLILKLKDEMPRGMSHFFRKISYILRAPLELKVLKEARCFIAKTPFAEEVIREVNPSACVYHIENMMRPAFFQVIPDYRLHRRILFVGTFLAEKGVRELFAAVNQLKRVSIVVVGSHMPLLDELCNKYPDVAVEHLGFMGAKEIAVEMMRVDLLVLPSYMDTSPNVVSEAMCAGLPVVATRVGGIPDMVIDGETGLLVPARNSKALAAAISSLIEDDHLRRSMGIAARKMGVERFAPEVALRKVRAAYSDIVRRSTGMNEEKN